MSEKSQLSNTKCKTVGPWDIHFVGQFECIHCKKENKLDLRVVFSDKEKKEESK